MAQSPLYSGGGLEADEVDIVDDSGRQIGIATISNEVDVDTNNPIDVSAATVTVTDDSQFDISTLPNVTLEDTGGVAVDPASEQTLSSELSREISSWSAGALAAAQSGDWSVAVEDSSGVQVDPAQNADGASSSASASGTGSANAATISVPDGRSTFTVAYDVSGSTTVTVEVSPDGGSTWYPLTTYNPGAAETNADSLETGFDDVRAYVGANLNSLHVGAKGV